MKLSIYIIILTSGLVKSNTIVFMDDNVYTTDNTCYTAENDIAKVHLPTSLMDKHKLFFVEADLMNNQRKGLFVLTTNITFKENMRINDNTARRLLQNGTSITSDTETVYFGTTNGIYTYNFSNDSTEKFGSVTANIKEIKKVIDEDLIYILTDDNQLYTVTEKGNKMTKHDTIKNVAEIAIDRKNNLYYYEIREDPENYQPFDVKYGKPKVLVGNNTIEIVGLPDKYTNMKLVDVLYVEEGAIVVINNRFYQIFSNGTSEDMKTTFLDLPTAYSIESGIFQIYGHDKKIFLYSIFESLEFQKAIGAALIVVQVVRVIGEGIKAALDNISYEKNAANSRKQ